MSAPAPRARVRSARRSSSRGASAGSAPGRERASDPAERTRLLLASLVLALVTIIVYAPVHGFPFIDNYDDSLYVTANPHVTSGLSAANFAWAFTHPVAGNWHPLTMLTHMADVSVFGLNAGQHHVVNLALHVLNTVLLLLVLVVYTRRPWPSAFVAGLFALHPLHVESVAWIAERKDVLSTAFWLLTLLAYHRWVRRRRPADLALALATFALGLMSKPMLVTLPAVLVLLDFWPLRRIREGEGGERGRITWVESLVEKWPFVLLSVASVALTLWAQAASGATEGTTLLPLGTRLANAVVAYVRYVGKLFAPVHLAFLYPYATHLPAAAVVGSAALLLAVTIGAVAVRKRAPYVTFGWLWFLGTLVPVIGIVQAGSQAMADRYTYVPHVGLYVAIAWAVADGAARARLPKWLPAAAAAIVLVACAALTRQEVVVWSSAERLFRTGVANTQGNYIGENNYAVELMNRGDLAGARQHFERAVEYNPTYGNALCNLGITDMKQGRLEDAREVLTRARAADPRNPKALLNLGFVLLLAKRPAEAIEPLEAARRLDPSNREGLEVLGAAYADDGRQLAQSGRHAEAIAALQQAVTLDPSNARARQDLAAESAATPGTGGH